MAECVLCNIALEIEDPQAITMGMGSEVIISGDAPPYTGEYEVTPSAETQYLETSGKLMTGRVKVNPIPQNYGLITYNGTTITVS